MALGPCLFWICWLSKTKNTQLMTVSTETVRMAKSRPRKNQSERSDLPCHIIRHINNCSREAAFSTQSPFYTWILVLCRPSYMTRFIIILCLYITFPSTCCWLLFRYPWVLIIDIFGLGVDLLRGENNAKIGLLTLVFRTSSLRSNKRRPSTNNSSVYNMHFVHTCTVNPANDRPQTNSGYFESIRSWGVR